MTREEVSRKFDEIVDFSGIEKFIDTPVKRYSSGMYVRLAFAVAAHLEPEILVVDEVLAVGDAEFQKKCLGKMGDVAEGGRTVLFVSHNMAAINSLCIQAMYLVNGSVASSGQTHNVVENYLSATAPIKTFDFRFENKQIGDQFAKILRVRFINSEHELVDRLVVNKGFGIEITYEILRGDEHKPVPTVFIKTRTGEGVFLSFETKRNGIFNKGVYKSIVWIPPNLMNDGIYDLVVGISTLNPAYNHCDAEIEFYVEDDVNAITRGDYKLHMHGNMRPLLIWETNCDHS